MQLGRPCIFSVGRQIGLSGSKVTTRGGEGEEVLWGNGNNKRHKSIPRPERSIDEGGIRSLAGARRATSGPER